jgi:glycosyltransferase involved in cell wall biosynthesis
MRLLLLSSGSYKSGLSAFRAVPVGQQLAKRGFNVSLIVPSADKYNNFTAETSPSIPDIKLIQPWQPKTHFASFNLIPYFFTALKVIFAARPDMIYLFKPTPATIMALIPKLVLRVPLVLDLDDLGSEVMRQQGQPKFQVWLVDMCERLALRQASAVVVTSRYLQDVIRKQYPTKPVLIMSNGVNPENYPMTPIKPPRPAIYYFGALQRLSLIEALLRALPATIAAVPETSVAILGGGQALPEARSLVRKLGIADKVVFTDWIDPLAITQYAEFADIALCMQPDTPTVRAASNVKVFQYMALGSVPVVSQVGDLPLYIQGTTPYTPVGVVVDADDVPALTKTLISLLTKPKQRARMAIRARQRAEDTYNWENLTQSLASFLLKQLYADESMQPTVPEASHA